MEATLVGGAAVRAVFGQLLSAVVRMKDKAIMFKQTLADLQSTLEALDPVIKEMEQQNNDLDRPKKELERLIREMEKGMKLVLTCSKIHRLNYLARVCRQDELMALLTSLVRFCLVEMQAQTARDQKETLIKVTRILSRVNKMPVVSTEDTKDSSLDSVHVPLNVSGSEIHDSTATYSAENGLGTDSAAEQIMETTMGSCSDSDRGLVDVSESKIDDSAATNQDTESEAGTNSSDQIMESIEAAQSKEKADNNKTTEHSMGEKSCDDQLGTAEKRFLGLHLRKIKWILPKISGLNSPVNKVTLEPPDPVQCTESVNCSKQNATLYTKVADETSHSGKNLFYNEQVRKMVHFEGYYNFDLGDLLRASAEVLGKGSYGTTYKAILENGTTVVVKRLREVLVGKREFEQQLEIVHRHTRHPNVIPLCAYYYYTDEKLLIYDYIAAGCFSWLLHGSRGTMQNPVDWNSRLKISLGAARGISHIHSASGSQFVHGNIKSSNILITADLEGCISDFGLIPLVNPFHKPSPNGYRAPEVFETGIFTQKSDVYSFGVLLLEMLTGETPVQYSPQDRVVDLPKWVESVIWEECTEEVFDVELQRHRNAKEDMVKLLHLAMTCVARVPDMRPSMEEVVEKIEEIGRAQTARDQKETLLKATGIPSRVSTEDAMNSTLDSVPVPVDMSGSEIHDSKATHPVENELGTNSAAEQVTMSSCLDSDPVPVDVSQSRIDDSVTTQTTENAARTNSAEQSKEKADNNKAMEQVNGKIAHFEGCSLNFDLKDLLRASYEVLGNGTHGLTYKVRLENEITLVVKRLKEVGQLVAGEKEFEQQLEIVHSLTQHPNVIPLRACYYTRDIKLLIYDYIAAGSFSRLLHENPVDWDFRLKISLGAARGIAHIHSASGSQFVHGNIKSSNVLITPDLEGCISDFGLISLVNPFVHPSQDGYRAPEVFETGTLTQKSDVYSFGVLLLEMLTGKTPVQYYPWQEPVVDLPEWVESVLQERWTDEVFDGVRLRYRDVKEDMVLMLKLAMICVTKVPDMRPAMQEVVEMIEEIIRASNGF